jgi:predicted hydrocarbon binding protein
MQPPSMQTKESIIKDHSKMFIGNLLVKMFYPNILSFFLSKVGLFDMEARVSDVGYRVAQKLLSVWAPKERKIDPLIKFFFKKMWNTKIVIKKVKSEDTIIYRIIDVSCKYCDPEVALEGVRHPCVTVIGYIKACLEYSSKKYPLPEYKLKTVKSRGSGNEYCEHQIIFRS